EAPRGAHIFRAFENTDPAKVRAVLLGQDPYPKLAWATGRAFEQGDLEEWWPEDARKVATSLRRLVQVIASARTGKPSYAVTDRAWRALILDAREGRCRLEEPKKFFNRLELEGVLFLNTSLTVSAVSANRAPKEYF